MQRERHSTCTKVVAVRTRSSSASASAGRPARSSTLARWAGPAELRIGRGAEWRAPPPHVVLPSAMRANPSSPASMDGHGGALRPESIRVPISASAPRAPEDRPAPDAGLGEEVQGEPPQLPVEGNHHGQAALQLGPCLAQVPAPVVEPAEVGHGRGERHQAHPTSFMCSCQDLDREVTHLAQASFGDRRYTGLGQRGQLESQQPTVVRCGGRGPEHLECELVMVLEPGLSPCRRTSGPTPGWPDRACDRSGRTAPAALPRNRQLRPGPGRSRDEQLDERRAVLEPGLVRLRKHVCESARGVDLGSGIPEPVSLNEDQCLGQVSVAARAQRRWGSRSTRSRTASTRPSRKSSSHWSREDPRGPLTVPGGHSMPDRGRGVDGGPPRRCRRVQPAARSGCSVTRRRRMCAAKSGCQWYQCLVRGGVIAGEEEPRRPSTSRGAPPLSSCRGCCR